MAGKQNITWTDAGKYRIQEFFDSAGLNKNLWWYVRKLYYPFKAMAELVLPDGESVMYDSYTGSIEDLSPLIKVNRQIEEHAVRVTDSFNTGRFISTLSGGEYIENLIVEKAPSGGYAVRAVFREGSPVQNRGAMVQVSASRGMSYIDELEDEVKKMQWVERLSGQKAKSLRPRLEEMYALFAGIVRQMPPDCMGLLSEWDKETVKLVGNNHKYPQPHIYTSLYRGQEWVFCMKYHGIDFLYDLNKDKVGFGNNARSVAGKIEFFQQNKGLYYLKTAKIRDNIPDGICVKSQMAAGEENIPFFNISISGNGVEGTLSAPCSADEGEMEKLYQKLDQIIHAIQKAEKTQEDTDAGPDGTGNNILVTDIIRHVSLLGKKEPLSSTVSSMRYGTAAKTDPGRGRYHMFSTREIETVVRRMASAGFLSIRSSKGKEWVLIKNKKLCNAVISAQPIHYETDTDYEKYTDADWEAFFKTERPEGMAGLEDWVSIMPLFRHRAFCCREMGRIHLFFRNAPEAIKEYIRTVAELEENKVIKKIMEMSVEGGEGWEH